ncbi:MAG: 2-amino-4-hydroxy-6-hydroxymethyldihydropteridine diphosphokinase [candidate division Zixibacteria bacterium]|nr:2-amino-4-hydroxy-6-hydroxymethyldihydropteridine diphosphokinase [candidate division Zixibacteria bacterium]
MAIAYIGLGSNLGDKKNNIRKAIDNIKEKKILKEIKTSSLYLTEPVGKKRQPDFLNLVIKGKTELSPFELLNSLLEIEKGLGRKRNKRWGPREIDLDILFYDDIMVNQENLVIPHPEIPNRRFVLVPLMELSPNLKHPLLNKNIKQLLKDTKDHSKVEPYGGIYAGE